MAPSMGVDTGIWAYMAWAASRLDIWAERSRYIRV